MNCSLSTVNLWISLAIALLLIAIGVSYGWTAAFPLFVAAGLVAVVVYVIIPQLKSALLNYAACRGSSAKCTMSLTIDTLGQVVGSLSVVSFTVAGIMEIAALAFLYSWILSWLGVSIQVAVAALVLSGQVACAIAILILIGVLSNAYSFKSCMDSQSSGTTIPVIEQQR